MGELGLRFDLFLVWVSVGDTAQPLEPRRIVAQSAAPVQRGRHITLLRRFHLT